MEIMKKRCRIGIKSYLLMSLAGIGILYIGIMVCAWRYVGNRIEEAYTHAYAESILDDMKIAVHDEMMVYDYFGLRNRMDSFIQEPQLSFIEIKDAKGNIIYRNTKGNGDGEDVYVVSGSIESGHRSIGSVNVGVSVVYIADIIRALVMVNLIIIISMSLSMIVAMLIAIKRVSDSIVEMAKNIRGINQYDNLKGIRLTGSSIKEIFILAEEYRMMMERLTESEKKNRESSALSAIGKISSQLVHDMRTPLSVLKCYMECVKDDGNEGGKEIKEAAKRSVKKLLVMSEDLLSYSKINNLSKSVVDMNEMLGGLIKECKVGESSRYLLRLRCEGDGDMVLYCRLDRYKFERAMSNMISNSLQAMNGDDGKVDVVCESYGNNLLITIEDNGCGISKENINCIFDMFYTAGKRGGTGLGLTYSKQIVEAHGGTINCDSKVGKGTIFTIRIPNCVVEDGDRADNKYLRENVTFKGTKGRRGTLNIILADDDDDMLADMGRKVRACGANVVYSVSTTDVIMSNDHIDYSRINAAIVDYEFKGSKQNGIDLIRHLKAMGVEKVHLCTGYYADDMVIRQAKEAGADWVLKKPLDDEDIFKIIS